MGGGELAVVGGRLLAQAWALRAAFPDPAALGAVAVDPLPSHNGDRDAAALAALRYLRHEMLLVRAGRAGTVGVLDDEIAHAERALGVG